METTLLDTTTTTTTLTSTTPQLFVQLSSGNVAAVQYSMSFGDIIVALLLLVVVAQLTVMMWISWRHQPWTTQ